jgi:release factor glutamine methyltransferase
VDRPAGVTGGDHGYRPMMPEERVHLLRRWHEAALAGGKRDREITVTAHGCTFVVPPDVYPPNPLGLAEIVRDEVREHDRVLDMGTGSGVNGIVAAACAREVVAVDVSPAAVECARRNGERNGVATRFHAVVGDLFDHVEGRFDLIVFDPPFRWFAPRSMAERGMADENYQTLTAFFDQAAGFLTPDGRILLSFGTTGDIDYRHHLIERGRYGLRELRRVEGEKDGVEVAYVAYRLTPPAGEVT